LPETHYELDDAKDGFDSLLAQSIQVSTVPALHVVRHPLDRASRGVNRWRFGQAIKPGPVMLIASLGDQRPDVSSETTFDIGLTEVAGIGKHGGGLSEVLRDFR
jgi:hypothetical protein